MRIFRSYERIYASESLHSHHIRIPSHTSIYTIFNPPTNFPSSLYSLDWETNLTRFQSDELSPSDEEWHRLLPPEALEALGKKEVQRQSVIFEVIKSEKEYVKDLLVIREVGDSYLTLILD